MDSVGFVYLSVTAAQAHMIAERGLASETVVLRIDDVDIFADSVSFHTDMARSKELVTPERNVLIRFNLDTVSEISNLASYGYEFDGANMFGWGERPFSIPAFEIDFWNASLKTWTEMTEFIIDVSVELEANERPRDMCLRLKEEQARVEGTPLNGVAEAGRRRRASAKISTRMAGDHLPEQRRQIVAHAAA